MRVHVLGIDPAPARGLTVWTDAGPYNRIIPVRQAGRWLRRVTALMRKRGEAVLVVWDAPLSFCDAHGFCERAVDLATRRVIGQHEDEERVYDPVQRKWILDPRPTRDLAYKAIGVQNLQANAHWALSCGVLGRPFASRDAGMWNMPGTPHLVESCPPGVYVVETHPAVVMGLRWILRRRAGGLLGVFPKYKGVRKAEVEAGIGEIVSSLQLDWRLLTCLEDNWRQAPDYVDAYVAWEMGQRFLARSAEWLGNPTEGGYVLPADAILDLGLVPKCERAAVELRSRLRGDS